MPIPESEILPYLYNSNNPGTKWGSSGLIPPRSLWKPVRQLMIADWLGLMESARGESFRSGQRRGPVALAEDKFYPRIINPSISLQLTPTTWGRLRESPGSILPRTVWKPQPHWLVADWLGLMEPAGGEGCLSCQGRGCATHGEIEVPSPDQNPSISLQFQQTGNQDGDPTGRYRPTQCVDLGS